MVEDIKIIGQNDTELWSKLWQHMRDKNMVGYNAEKVTPRLQTFSYQGYHYHANFSTEEGLWFEQYLTATVNHDSEPIESSTHQASTTTTFLFNSLFRETVRKLLETITWKNDPNQWEKLHEHTNRMGLYGEHSKLRVFSFLRGDFMYDAKFDFKHGLSFEKYSLDPLPIQTAESLAAEHRKSNEEIVTSHERCKVARDAENRVIRFQDSELLRIIKRKYTELQEEQCQRESNLKILESLRQDIASIKAGLLKEIIDEYEDDEK